VGPAGRGVEGNDAQIPFEHPSWVKAHQRFIDPHETKKRQREGGKYSVEMNYKFNVQILLDGDYFTKSQQGPRPFGMDVGDLQLYK